MYRKLYTYLKFYAPVGASSANTISKAPPTTSAETRSGTWTDRKTGSCPNFQLPSDKMNFYRPYTRFGISQESKIASMT